MRLAALPILLAGLLIPTAAHAEDDVEHAPSTEWLSPALAGSGIAVGGTGTLIVVLATAWYEADKNAELEEGDTPEMNPGYTVGPPLMVVGAGMILAGGIMFGAGAWQVPRDDGPPVEVSLRVGPRSELGVRF